MSENILKADLEQRIQDRIEKLKSGVASDAFKAEPAMPDEILARNEIRVEQLMGGIEATESELRNLLHMAGKHVPQIWDQTKEAAAYILIGKAFSNLQSLVILAREGKSLEFVEIARSGQEALHLAFLFLEDGQESKMEKWFKGGTISNEVARKRLHRTINETPCSDGKEETQYPVDQVTSDIYGIFSLFTHSCYPALLDSIDVFTEDLDFEKRSGFHYVIQYGHLAYSLRVNIVLELKNFFIKCNDQEAYQASERLLQKIWVKATKEEIEQAMKRYTA